jgi:predicted DNA-binding protein with PD1-like motif
MTRIESCGRQALRHVFQFRVRPGADLLAAMEEAVGAEDISCGVIVSGLGALRKAVFRNLKQFPAVYPVRPEDRLYLDLERPMELVSLGGWIAPRDDGQTEIHAHFSASCVEGETVVTLGGHLTRGTVCGIKVVVAILVLDAAGVAAAIDPDTQTLDIHFKRLPARP